MEVRRDVDDLCGVYDIVEWDDKAKAVLDRIFEEDREDEAFEIIEDALGGDIPDEWDVVEFVKNDLERELYSV